MWQSSQSSAAFQYATPFFHNEPNYKPEDDLNVDATIAVHSSAPPPPTIMQMIAEDPGVCFHWKLPHPHYSRN